MIGLLIGLPFMLIGLTIRLLVLFFRLTYWTVKASIYVIGTGVALGTSLTVLIVGAVHSRRNGRDPI